MGSEWPVLKADRLHTPPERRQIAWQRLARELSPTVIADNTETVRLDAVPALAAQLLAGQVRGRVWVDLQT